MLSVKVFPPGKVAEAIVEFDKSEITIGRDANNDIVLVDNQISRRHAKITLTSSDYKFSDLGSTNGSWTADQRLSSCILSQGQVIRMGGHQLQFSFQPEIQQKEEIHRAISEPLSPSHDRLPIQFAPRTMHTREILLLGESNSRKSAFLNLLMGIPFFPDKLNIRKLPVCKIHAGRKSGLWLNEGNDRLKPLNEWEDAPVDWHSFLHTELTLAEHPLLNNGLILWDLPDIDTLSGRERERVEEFLEKHPSNYRLVQYFTGIEICDPGLQFIQRWKSRLKNLVIVCCVHEKLSEIQYSEMESRLKRFVVAHLGTIPAFNLSFGEAYLAFIASSMTRHGTTNPWELARKWKDLYVPIEDIFQGYTDSLRGEELFEHILELAQEKADSYSDLTEMDQGKLRMSVEEEDPHAHFELGRRLLKEGKTERALSLLTRAATAGLPEAQSLVGSCYWDGKGVTRDAQIAAGWFQKAARGGDPTGLACWGWCLLTGRGEEKNVSRALDCFRRAAERDDPRGQAGLGLCFYQGGGIPRDYSQALKWFQKAAGRGDLEGLYFLGECYYRGRGTKTNCVEAVKFFRQAAEEGHQTAKAMLGTAYVFGFGVKKNIHEGLPLIMDAAEKGDPQAAVIMGDFYENGIGVRQNLPEACKWYQLAADRGSPGGKACLGALILNGRGVQKDTQLGFNLIREAAAENDSTAICLLAACYLNLEGDLKVQEDIPRGISLLRELVKAGGNEEACLMLGLCHLLGKGVSQDYAEGVRLIREAAEMEMIPAATQLANCYATGIGVPQDLTEAIKWLKIAAEREDAEAQGLLSWSYYRGAGVKQNYVEAFQWAQKAADRGDAHAQLVLGLCYSEGNGVQKSLVDGVNWTRRSAEQGNANAQCFLGEYLIEGSGVTINLEEAKRWLLKAAEQNQPRAMFDLGRMAYEAHEYFNAFKWVSESARLGNDYAVKLLGDCYRNGIGTTTDKAKALECYQKAAQLGVENAEKAYTDLKGEMENPSTSNCFVATATFGTPYTEEVLILRRFREEHLMTCQLGRLFIESYIKFGPTLAAWIRKHPSSRRLIAPLLSRVTKMIRY